MEVPVSIIGGVIVIKTGRYKPLHFLAFALLLFGFGMFAHFDRGTLTVEWVIVQTITAVGVSLLMSTLMSTTLLAVQVDLPAQDVAAATAAFAFMRAYGFIWGVAIPSASFNSRFAAEAYRITDERTRQQDRKSVV